MSIRNFPHVVCMHVCLYVGVHKYVVMICQGNFIFLMTCSMVGKDCSY